MEWQIKTPFDLSVEALDRELIARGAQVPAEKRYEFPDSEGTYLRDIAMAEMDELYTAAAVPQPEKALSHLSTRDLLEMLRTGIRKDYDVKGIWYRDDRLDYYEIEDESIKKNSRCVAAICMASHLEDIGNGCSQIKVKPYGTAFNLCRDEPFYRQPTAAGPLCTGFLVNRDTLVTAGHFVDENRLNSLRFFFGFKMSDHSTPVLCVPNENIYKGIKLIGRKYNFKSKDSDWAVVKLDREVSGQTLAVLSRAPVSNGQAAYTIGHPLGLPLKYAPGTCIDDVHETCFSARLDLYSGNSGSPIFDGNTHEVIGIVVRGYRMDLRWTGSCWLSIIYPNNEIHSQIPHCTRVSEFIDECANKN